MHTSDLKCICIHLCVHVLIRQRLSAMISRRRVQCNKWKFRWMKSSRAAVCLPSIQSPNTKITWRRNSCISMHNQIRKPQRLQKVRQPDRTYPVASVVLDSFASVWPVHYFQTPWLQGIPIEQKNLSWPLPTTTTPYNLRYINTFIHNVPKLWWKRLRCLLRLCR